MSQVKCLPDNGIREERFLQQNRDSSRDRSDHRGCIGRTRMIRNKQASALWDPFRARDAHAHSGRAHKKHHAANSAQYNASGFLEMTV